MNKISSANIFNAIVCFLTLASSLLHVISTIISVVVVSKKEFSLKGSEFFIPFGISSCASLVLVLFSIVLLFKFNSSHPDSEQRINKSMLTGLFAIMSGFCFGLSLMEVIITGNMKSAITSELFSYALLFYASSISQALISFLNVISSVVMMNQTFQTKPEQEEIARL